ncbi:ribonuclease HI family protein [Enterococcus timonensis]|uniref:ribonuclease HI family protein n=1 Tax=Enterococcus timonensis TaxID=1852364 RepID=UPI0008DA5D78|nr:ribonuclease HI family protein [Enterococcus timonensis]
MLKIYVDAATKNQSGPSAAGIFFKAEKKTHTYGVTLGEMTNHEAEFLAVIHGLKILLEQHLEKETIFMYSDSKVVVETWQKKASANPLFQPLWQRLSFLLEKFPDFTLTWQSDKKNAGAHTIAQQTLRKMRS